MQYTRLGSLRVSRLIIGGNPFSGYSHRGIQADRDMMRYYTSGRIKETLAEAEQLGINTFVGRADNHIIRILLEYWDEGGNIQWLAQTCPEYLTLERSIRKAKDYGAKACHIHGGTMDYLYAHDELDETKKAIELMRNAGLAASVAGHRPDVFRWAETNIDVDYYMCSYYDPSPRREKAEHFSGGDENFREADRQAMLELISGLSKPVVHYKIFACGRHDPAEAFTHAARHMRDSDAVCIGVYTKENSSMLADDVRLFERSMADMKKVERTEA